jgi:pyruvate,water dikinase
MIDRPADVFYLTLDELHGSLDGHLTVQDLRRLIELRKTTYREYETREPPPRIVTRGPVYGPAELGDAEAATSVNLPDGCLAGQGCSPGRVEGTVKIVRSATDDIELGGQILATSRTDPGWIPLYPSLSGLLVERGGLLSHSAIVAREMGLPTIVGVRGLLAAVRDGQRVRMDGTSGIVEILPERPPGGELAIASAGDGTLGATAENAENARAADCCVA